MPTIVSGPGVPMIVGDCLPQVPGPGVVLDVVVDVDEVVVGATVVEVDEVVVVGATVVELDEFDEVVVVGATTSLSKALMSSAVPCGRDTRRWSVVSAV